MDKKHVAEILEEMGTLLELQGANPFKSRAFQNASRAVEGLTIDLRALVEAGDLVKVKGIGKSIAEIVTDLVRAGSSKDYDELKKTVPDGVLEMLKIQGLGPKKVRILFEKLNITSVDGLEKAAQENVLADVTGFGRKTQENILAGIEALRRSSERHLYPRAFHLAESILNNLIESGEVDRGEIAGSLRRKKETIGDIDIIISVKGKGRERLMRLFTEHPNVDRVIGSGETKSSVTLTSGIDCDLRIVDDKEFPFALNYFTGSKEHNVEMRSRARKLGWSLNEYGFSAMDASEFRGKAKRLVKCREEQDVYEALGLQFIPPELREDTGEFEAAEREEIPTLVELSDIRGTFHCHSTYSDGLNTMEEMARAAEALGWEYLGIGDHSRVAAYAGGLSVERVNEQQKEIDAINAGMKKIRLLKGTECDILPNGDLDWPANLLSTFDYVVVSIHSSFKMTESEMTKRIIKGLKNKYVTMLGHPTGRLLLSREPYPVNMISVIDAAADYGKMIEINANPMRLDLDWRLCRYAKEKGVMIVINPDAHSIAGLEDVNYGVGVARKGWLTKKDVLNSRTLKDVMKILNRNIP